MRRAWLVIALVLPLTLSGCLLTGDDGPPREQDHDDCWFFCFGGGDEMHVHFDFFWPLLFIAIIAIVIGVAAAGGGHGGQEQQQQVVIVRGDGRGPDDEKQR